MTPPSPFLLKPITKTFNELDQLQQAICESDATTLYDMFVEAHDARAHFRRLLDARERDCGR